MADIFDEVEEGVRQDRLASLWRSYGWAAWLLIGAIVGGVALYEFLGYQNRERVEANTLAFERGLDELTTQEYQAAGDTLDTLIVKGDEVAPAAAQYLAQVRLDGNGDPLAASETLLASIDGEADTPSEKLALLKAAYLRADELSRAELQDMLGGLSGESSAFGALALELVAAKAMQDGDYAFARTEFNLIRVSANVPPGVLRRADQALAAMPVVITETTPAGAATAPAEEETPE